jgi:hypothetical protein
LQRCGDALGGDGHGHLHGMFVEEVSDGSGLCAGRNTHQAALAAEAHWTAAVVVVLWAKSGGVACAVT